MMEVNSNQPEETRYVLHRRFDRMGRLVGDSGMEKLFAAHVMIIGIGGVGSWTAESLARLVVIWMNSADASAAITGTVASRPYVTAA